MNAEIHPTTMTLNRLFLVSAVLLMLSPISWSQKNSPPPHGNKGTVVHNANLYAQADESAARVSTVTPGRELIIAERSDKWLRVFANTDVEVVNQNDAPVFGNETNAQPISGWILDKGVVTAATPNGDSI